MVFQVHKARPNSLIPKTTVKKSSVTRENSTRACPFSDVSIPFLDFITLFSNSYIILSSKSGVGSNVAEHHLGRKSCILQHTYHPWHERVKRITDNADRDRLRRIDWVIGRGAAARRDSDHRGS